MQKKILRWQETIFFIIYLILFPMFTALQYSSDYGKDTFINTFTYLGISKIFDLLPFIIFYKTIIPKFLFTRRYLAFILGLIGFLVAFDLYLHFVTDLVVSKISFLPKGVAKTAANAYQQHRVPRQSIHYTLMNLAGIIGLAYFVRTIEKEKQVQTLIKQQWKLELNALRDQLHPHFFFNTLNNIYSLALQNSAFTAPVTYKLATMMRYMLYETSVPKVLLSKDIQFIEDYIELERLRLNDHVQVSFDQQGEAEYLEIEPFLLLPFIENAFKHGAEHEVTNGYITVIILIENKELSLQVKNSKPDAGQSGRGEGVGLSNVKKRLEILYPGKYRLYFSETHDSFSIFLNVSLS